MTTEGPNTNPHVAFLEDGGADTEGDALLQALLAVAYELHTANLIAVANGGRSTPTIRRRLGLDDSHHATHPTEGDHR
jgi:hypothetical protein